MVQEIKFKYHRYGSYDYKSASIDMDYVGWNYKDPENCDVVVVLNMYLYKFGEDEEDKEILKIHNPKFEITTWENFSNSKVCSGFYHICLFFTKTPPDVIVKCVKDYIVNESYNIGNENKKHREEIKIFKDIINRIELHTNVSYTKPIKFDRKKGIMLNI